MENFNVIKDKRAVLAALIASFFFIISFSFFILRVDGFGLMSVPIMRPCFADLRVMTTGLDAIRAGHDPIESNPFDPWQRPFNYPRLWYLLGALGMGGRHTVLLAVVLIVSFYLSFLCLLPRSLTRKTIVFYAFVLCSPTVLLAVERGNNDMVIFCIIATALIWGKGREVLFQVLLLLASCLKLYPVFALFPRIVMGLRRNRQMAIISLCGFLIYAYFIREDIATIYRVSPQMNYFSYGAKILVRYLIDGPLALMVSHEALRFMLLFCASLGVFVLVRAMRPPFLQVSSSFNAHFQTGCAIFLGTFILGNSFDYRMIFLLLTLPFLMDMGSLSGLAGRLARVAIVLIFLLLWSPLWIGFCPAVISWEGGCLLKEVVCWALVVILGAFLASSILLKRKQLVNN